MTAEQLQDPVSTPVTAHLTPVQRAVFNQAVSAYLAERAQESGSKAPWHPEGVKLVFAGDESGQLQYLRSYDIRRGAYAEVQLALMHVQESSSDKPSAHFMAATVTETGGTAEVRSVQVLDLTELFSHSIEVEYRHNNTGCRGVCPLSGEVFKPYIGEYPFLAGTWTPVFEEILPPAGPANADLSRASWTVGEVQAFMVSQWRAASVARKETTPSAPALPLEDCPF
jgi:hypothetical protein